MNMSKEYIDLCKNKKVQELRPELQQYDWYYYYNEVHLLENTKYFNLRHVSFWLPTGDQLDEEIVKICEKENLEYGFLFYEGIYTAVVSTIPLAETEGYIPRELEERNPLIAKIKLLIQLRS